MNSDAGLIQEISELTTENSLVDLRKKFWEKEFKLTLNTHSHFEKTLARDPCRLILLDEKSAEQILGDSTKLKTEVIEMQFADSLLYQDGHWWLHSFYSNALSQLIVKRAPTLNTHAVAYITGDTFYSMMSAVIAIKMGFQNITFVVEDIRKISAKIDHLNKKFFGLSIRSIQDSELTLQPSNGSLLINNLFGDEAEALAEDLTYLNFLEKQNSLIVELCFSKDKNEVVLEAEHVSIPYVLSSELWGLRDYLALKAVLPEFDLTSEQYLEKWQSFLSS